MICDLTHIKLTGFLDANYAGCKDTFKSTFGGAQFLGEKLVSWSSKKQDCTALSTAKAEYVFLSACCAQVLWMQTQLTDYGFDFNKILIYCDSKSAIAISCNPVQHPRAKHIAVRYHFIKEHVEKGTIELYFVKMDYQLADLFTKVLPVDRFNYLVRCLSMRNLSPWELWNALEERYVIKDPTSTKIIVSKFNSYKMVDSCTIMDQMYELEHILSMFTQNNMNMDESIQVSSIIDKLPSTWKDVKRNRKYHKDDLSLKDLSKHLLIEEQYRLENKANDDTSKVHIMEEKGESSKAGVKKHRHDDKEKKKSKRTKRMSSATTAKSQDISSENAMFKTYEPSNAMLYIGNHSTAQVKGKGKIDLMYTSGNTLTLKYVLYVPDNLKNLVSGSMINKFGFKLVFESDKFILSKHGKFACKGYHTNGMFKLNIKDVVNSIVNDVNMTKQLKKANALLTQELKECKSILDESNRARDRYLVALHDKEIELEKYKRYHDCTMENDKLERLIKEKNKVIQDFKLKEEEDLEKLITVEKQIKFLNDIVYKRNQSIKTIHTLAPKSSSSYNGRPSYANPKCLKKAQSENPCLYPIAYDKDDLANIFAPDREETLTLEQK
nr:retrovirus-related Pol polyprotein from transposon TNT 1-94 [Tanacetum cinerariifolium]